MEVKQIKVPFLWIEPKPRVTVPDRLKFCSLEESSDQEFLTTIRLCLANSLDTNDRTLLAEVGEFELARRCFEEVESTFDYQRSWWDLAYTKNGDLVGFTQPVIFRGCQKDNLEEGTIYSFGVVPRYRGHGYSQDLLLKATAVLQDVGVWRIFTDVDELNIPSLKAFFSIGYENASKYPEFADVKKWASKIKTARDLPS